MHLQLYLLHMLLFTSQGREKEVASLVILVAVPAIAFGALSDNHLPRYNKQLKYL
ncbi:MAG TPA: hypothetical protein VE971_02315 [Candidatus Eisenbacteria bacterium]|nr:hypothetical protein [Candidatus Eisenbacteria bacterium]